MLVRARASGIQNRTWPLSAAASSSRRSGAAGALPATCCRPSSARPRAPGSSASRRARLFTGWGTWFGNRRAGLRDRWFRLRTHGAYRNAPQP
jgi:hypothetical protein